MHILHFIHRCGIWQCAPHTVHWLHTGDALCTWIMKQIPRKFMGRFYWNFSRIMDISRERHDTFSEKSLNQKKIVGTKKFLSCKFWHNYSNCSALKEPYRRRYGKIFIKIIQAEKFVVLPITFTTITSVWDCNKDVIIIDGKCKYNYKQLITSSTILPILLISLNCQENWSLLNNLLHVDKILYLNSYLSKLSLWKFSKAIILLTTT